MKVAEVVTVGVGQVQVHISITIIILLVIARLPVCQSKWIKLFTEKISITYKESTWMCT